LKPTFDVTDSSFIITLPNMNYKNGNIENKQRLLLIEFIKEHGNVTREMVATELNLSATRSYELLKELMNEKKVVTAKNGRKLEYRLS
jgi:predicted HTH transcriptional regulator